MQLLQNNKYLNSSFKVLSVTPTHENDKIAWDTCVLVDWFFVTQYSKTPLSDNGIEYKSCILFTSIDVTI